MKDYIYILFMVLITMLIIIGYPKKCKAGTASDVKNPVENDDGGTNCSWHTAIGEEEQGTICKSFTEGCYYNQPMDNEQISLNCGGNEDAPSPLQWTCKDEIKDCNDYNLEFVGNNENCALNATDYSMFSNDDPQSLSEYMKSNLPECMSVCKDVNSGLTCSPEGTGINSTQINLQNGDSGGRVIPFPELSVGDNTTVYESCELDNCPGCCIIPLSEYEPHTADVMLYNNFGQLNDDLLYEQGGWEADTPGLGPDKGRCPSQTTGQPTTDPDNPTATKCIINNTRSTKSISKILDSKSDCENKVCEKENKAVDNLMTNNINNVHPPKDPQSGLGPDNLCKYLGSQTPNGDNMGFYNRGKHQDSFTCEWRNTDSFDPRPVDNQQNGVCVSVKLRDDLHGINNKISDNFVNNTSDVNGWGDQNIRGKLYVNSVTDDDPQVPDYNNVKYLDGSNHLTVDFKDENCYIKNADECDAVDNCLWVQTDVVSNEGINNYCISSQPANSNVTDKESENYYKDVQLQASSYCRNAAAWNKIIDFSHRVNEGVCHNVDEQLTFKNGEWEKSKSGGLLVSYTPFPNPDIDITDDNFEWTWKFKEIKQKMSVKIAEYLVSDDGKSSMLSLLKENDDNIKDIQVGNKDTIVEQVHPYINAQDNINDGVNLSSAFVNHHSALIQPFKIEYNTSPADATGAAAKVRNALVNLKVPMKAVLQGPDDNDSETMIDDNDSETMIDVSIGNLNNLTLEEEVDGDETNKSANVVFVLSATEQVDCSELMENHLGYVEDTMAWHNTDTFDGQDEDGPNGTIYPVDPSRAPVDRRNCLIAGQTFDIYTKDESTMPNTNGCVWTPKYKQLTAPVELSDVKTLIKNSTGWTPTDTNDSEFAKLSGNCTGWKPKMSNDDDGGKSNFMKDGSNLENGPNDYSQYINTQSMVDSSWYDASQEATKFPLLSAFATDNPTLKSLANKTAIQCFTPGVEDGMYKPTNDVIKNLGWDESQLDTDGGDAYLVSCINPSTPFSNTSTTSIDETAQSSPTLCKNFENPPNSDKSNTIDKCTSNTSLFSGQWLSYDDDKFGYGQSDSNKYKSWPQPTNTTFPTGEEDLKKLMQKLDCKQCSNKSSEYCPGETSYGLLCDPAQENGEVCVRFNDNDDYDDITAVQKCNNAWAKQFCPSPSPSPPDQVPNLN